MSSYCQTCQRVTEDDRVCLVCGTPRGPTPGFLPLIGWLLIPFSVPVYPVMGALSTLAMFAIAYGSDVLGVRGGFRIVAIAVTGYVALILTLRIERSASRAKAYRIFRWFTRVVVCAAIGLTALQGTGKSLSPANALFIVVVGVPLLLLIAHLLDRVLGVGGPAKSPESKAEPGFWKSLNWRNAIAIGIFPGIIGALIGREGGLFFGALLWLLTVVIVIGFEVAGRLLGSFTGAVGNWRLRWPDGAPGAMLSTLCAILAGAAIGVVAIAGLLTAMGEGDDLELTSVIIPAILGSIIGLVINRFRRRRAAATGG